MGTGDRAFNAAAMLPPNPTVTRSVIGEQAPIKSLLFPALSSRLEKSMNWHSVAGVISHHGPPREVQGQRSCVTEPPVPPDPRTDVVLPREGSSDGSQRFNHSRRDYCHDVQVCSRLSQYQMMCRSWIQGNHTPSSPKCPVTGWLEAMLVRRPRVGQRAIPLSRSTQTPTPYNLGLPLDL